MTQAGIVCKCGRTAAAWAPLQPIHGLGNCLTVSQWVVMGFSNLELTCWSPGVGRIVLTPPLPLEGIKSIWRFFALGQELLTSGFLVEKWQLVVCSPSHGNIPFCFIFVPARRIQTAATASQLKVGTFQLKGGEFYICFTNFIACNIGATCFSSIGLLAPFVALCYTYR